MLCGGTLKAEPKSYLHILQSLREQVKRSSTQMKTHREKTSIPQAQCKPLPTLKMHFSNATSIYPYIPIDIIYIYISLDI